MRLESFQPTTESEFYACLSRLLFSRIFFERIEPSNESGFPDIYYVIRNGMGEGTIELKHADTGLPNLCTLSQGTQKAALLNYNEAGGRRRFALCYCNGRVYLWTTSAYAAAIRADGRGWSWSASPHESQFIPRLMGQLSYDN